MNYDPIANGAVSADLDAGRDLDASVPRDAAGTRDAAQLGDASGMQDAKVDAAIMTEAGNPNDASPASDAASDAAGGTESGVDAAIACVDHMAEIAVVAGKVSGTHTNFPLLVSITASWLKTVANTGLVANDNGYDIHFTADIEGTTSLDHEVERYDGVAGTLVAWVRIPTLSASTKIYMLYGCDVAVPSERPAAVWSPEYRAVWHLNSANDSTSNANNCTENNTQVTAQAKIGGGRTFGGGTGRMLAAATASTDNVPVGGATISAWAKPATSGEQHVGFIVVKISGTMDCLPCNPHENGWGLVMGPEMGFGVGKNTLDFRNDYSGIPAHWQGPASAWSPNQWVAVTVVYTRGDPLPPVMYINGQPSNMVLFNGGSGTPLADTGQPVVIGNSPDELRTFNGTIDEVRIVHATRAANWIATEYANQNAPASFYVVTQL